MTHGLGKRIAILLASSVVLLAGLEGAARKGLPFGLLEPYFGVPAGAFEHVRHYVLTSDTPAHVGDAHVVYRGRPGYQDVNRWGARGVDWEVEKGEALRIACLGASTTEGGTAKSYPDHLQTYLDQREGRPAEVMNWGTSGWTTAETLVNYMLRVQDFAPDLVLVHHAVNDVGARLWPEFMSDYSHMRRPWCPPQFGAVDRWLVEHSVFWASLQARLRGGLVIANFAMRPHPEGLRLEAEALSENPPATFRRNIATLCDTIALRGGVPVLLTMPMSPDEVHGPAWRRLGTAEHNEVLRDVALERDYHVVDLERIFEERSDDVREDFVDLVHLTSRGDRLKASFVFRYLEREGLL